MSEAQAQSTQSKGPDFFYYKWINENQHQFHKSKARHKLLIGTYRAGKTYPAIHEALFICMDNPGHVFGVFRNTEDSLRVNVEKEFVEIAEAAGFIKEWKSSKHDLLLTNNTMVRFRWLSMQRTELKGMSMCGFLIDDPNVERFKEVISFLYTRLTNPHNRKAKYFATIICANYEGHDWLWRTYMRRRKEGGDGPFAWWFCRTKDNETNDENYVEDLDAFHSEAWMRRYIKGDLNVYVGLVYDEYDPEYHDRNLSWCVDDNSLHKILVIDLGITHPTVVLKAATDRNNIYFYHEWYKVNIRTHDLGDYLLELLEGPEDFKKIIIDPKSCAREQTSGLSPRKILKDEFGIGNIKLAKNNIKYGIEVQKGIMSVRDEIDPEDQTKTEKKTHFFVDPQACPHVVAELESLKWKEPDYSEYNELAYKEEPVDKDNDATDCTRYGSVYFRKFLNPLKVKTRRLDEQKRNYWNRKLSSSKMYRHRTSVRNMIEHELTKELHDNRVKKYSRHQMIQRARGRA